MKTENDVPLWRSMLFVPVLAERFIAKAAQRGADAIQLDLEDSIPADRKAKARAAVAAAAARLAAPRHDIIVRVNRPWAWLTADIEAAVCADVDVINLPKVDSVAQVREVAALVADCERRRGLAIGRIRLLAMIETARGLEDVGAIAGAHPRLIAITAGAEDLAADFGGRPTEDLLVYANMRVLGAARAAGIMPIGYFGSVADYADIDAFAVMARRAAAVGFEGGFCIHPAQVDPLNRAFAPTAEAVEQARGVVAAYEAAARDGRGAIEYDGRMLDEPMVAQARQLMARQARIEAREQR